jgi:hypothetical protein
MKQLQAQVEMLRKQVFSTENTIFRALIGTQHKKHIRLEPILAQKHAFPQELESAVSPAKPIEEAASIISPALLAWGQLPNFDTQVVQTHKVRASNLQQESSALPSDQHILSNKINASASADAHTPHNAHQPSNEQAKIPWWLHNVDSSSQELLETHQIDQQSAHIDYVVQRWFERWGKRSMDAKRPQEDQIE